MSIPSWARKGAKVVCVDEKITLWPGTSWLTRIWCWLNGTRQPRKGEIVIIEHVYVEHGRAWLELVGFDGWGYEPRHFRPLVEPKTEAEDVAMFKRLIHDQEPVSA